MKSYTRLELFVDIIFLCFCSFILVESILPEYRSHSLSNYLFFLIPILVSLNIIELINKEKIKNYVFIGIIIEIYLWDSIVDSFFYYSPLTSFEIFLIMSIFLVFVPVIILLMSKGSKKIILQSSLILGINIFIYFFPFMLKSFYSSTVLTARTVAYTYFSWGLLLIIIDIYLRYRIKYNSKKLHLEMENLN